MQSELDLDMDPDNIACQSENFQGSEQGFQDKNQMVETDDNDVEGENDDGDGEEAANISNDLSGDAKNRVGDLIVRNAAEEENNAVNGNVERQFNIDMINGNDNGEDSDHGYCEENYDGDDQGDVDADHQRQLIHENSDEEVNEEISDDNEAGAAELQDSTRWNISGPHVNNDKLMDMVWGDFRTRVVIPNGLEKYASESCIFNGFVDIGMHQPHRLNRGTIPNLYGWDREMPAFVCKKDFFA